MDVSLIHGTRFLRCDGRGDLTGATHGLFAHDTRLLARWCLRIDGARPQPLGDPRGEHGERSFVQRAVGSRTVPAGRVLVRRRMLVAADAMHVRLELENLTPDAISQSVRLDLATDFDDLMAVKSVAFASLGDDTGDVGGATAGGGPLVTPTATSDRSVELHPVGSDAAIDLLHCRIAATHPFTLDGSQLCWQVEHEPRGTWQCDLQITWSGARAEHAFDDAVRAADERTRRWTASTPRLQIADPDLARTWRRSVEDLGMLRVPLPASAGSRETDATAPADADEHLLIAAGAPWFMAVFGRDSLITCLQTMALGAHRARGVLRYLAQCQSLVDDPERDAEPGKILHEVREGAVADRGFDRYYGSIDSTPLFVMLLAEYHAWTGDDSLVDELWPAAMRALGWIERHGDLDGDGLLEYERRSTHGLVNQSWKDSHDSQTHADGTFATGAIAPVEAQAYAYAARRGLARLARQVRSDADLGARLDQDADALREQIDTSFGVPVATAGDPCFALALDGDKRQLQVASSNLGHLPWCDAVAPAAAARIADRLLRSDLWNGWGIRTMSSAAHAYSPLSYHCGSVWPHDTGIAIAGLARAGHPHAAAELTRGLLDAASWFDGRLPEVFAGLARDETSWPVPFPTASSPQAWAAGASVHALTSLLGLVPDPVEQTLRSDATWLPAWLDGLELDGIGAHGSTWNVRVERGRARVTRTSD